MMKKATIFIISIFIIILLSINYLVASQFKLHVKERLEDILRTEEKKESKIVIELSSNTLSTQKSQKVKNLNTEKSHLTLDRGVIAKNVEGRTPLGVNDVFPNDVGKLYCFTEISGATPGEKITHAWYYEDKLIATIELPLKRSRTYTWSYVKILPVWVGDWKVHIIDEEKKTVSVVPFRIEE